MNESINGSSINGSKTLSWIVNASVTAAALAVVVGNVEAKRTTYGSATGNAAVTVTVTEHKKVFGYATGLASASSYIEPTVKYAGSCNAVATATGYAAVSSLVYAEASGVATATGFVLTAQALGEATANANCAIVQANAHVVKFGGANASCGASGSVSGSDVTRYAQLDSQLSGALAASVDAAVMLSGDSFYYYDGYCNAQGTATGTIDPDKTDVITTLGIFDYGNSDASANAHIVHYGAASVSAICAGIMANAYAIRYPTVDATGAATLSANATRNVLPTATLTASATRDNAKAKITYAGSAQGDATANAVQAVGGKLLSGAGNGLAGAESYDTNGTKIQYGSLTDSIANALTGRAYAFSNADVKAPDERYMIVETMDRNMIIASEDRLMMVAA